MTPRAGGESIGNARIGTAKPEIFLRAPEWLDFDMQIADVFV